MSKQPSLSPPVMVLEGHSGLVKSAVYSPDGNWMASGSTDGTIIVRESGSNQVMYTLVHGDKGVFSVVFSPDSTRLLSGSYDRTARVWDVASGECLSVLEHPSMVNSVAWSPDDTFFLTGCDDKNVRQWDAATYECLHVLEGHVNYVWSLAISPDSSFFVSGGYDHRTIVWGVYPGEAPRVRRRLDGHTGIVGAIAVSPDNNMIATASPDCTVKMWGVAGDELWTVGVGEKAYPVAFSPGGRFLAVGVTIFTKAVAPDGIKRMPPSTILIMDPGTGTVVGRLDGHGKAVRSLSYHPLGHTLLSGAEDCTCRKWQLPSDLIDPPSQ